MKTYEIIIQRRGSRTISADSRERAEEIAKSSNPEDFLYDDEINITDIYETDSNETMFRCDDDPKNRPMNPVDVISFEVFELNNTDILDYCLTNYIDKQITKYPQFGNTYDIISAIEHDEEVREYWYDKYQNDFKDEENPIIKFIEMLETILHTKINFVLWLAEKTSVETLYMNSSCTVYEYKTSDVVLSDLGFDGKLFAYKDRPEFIKQYDD
jgi:hypothetical protein